MLPLEVDHRGQNCERWHSSSSSGLCAALPKGISSWVPCITHGKVWIFALGFSMYVLSVDRPCPFWILMFSLFLPPAPLPPASFCLSLSFSPLQTQIDICALQSLHFMGAINFWWSACASSLCIPFSVCPGAHARSQGTRSDSPSAGSRGCLDFPATRACPAAARSSSFPTGNHSTFWG